MTDPTDQVIPVVFSELKFSSSVADMVGIWWNVTLLRLLRLLRKAKCFDPMDHGEELLNTTVNRVLSLLLDQGLHCNT